MATGRIKVSGKNLQKKKNIVWLGIAVSKGRLNKKLPEKTHDFPTFLHAKSVAPQLQLHSGGFCIAKSLSLTEYEARSIAMHACTTRLPHVRLEHFHKPASKMK